MQQCVFYFRLIKYQWQNMSVDILFIIVVEVAYVLFVVTWNSVVEEVIGRFKLCLLQRHEVPDGSLTKPCLADFSCHVTHFDVSKLAHCTHFITSRQIKSN